MSRLRLPLQSSHSRSFRSGSDVRQAERRGGEAKHGFVATSGASSTSTQFKLGSMDAKVNNAPFRSTRALLRCNLSLLRKRTGRPLFRLSAHLACSRFPGRALSMMMTATSRPACSCVSVTCTYACFLYNITVLVRPLICTSSSSLQ